MTSDDIIRMAREAGFLTGTIGPLNTPFVTQVAGSFVIELERFAALVAAAERKTCEVACAKVCDDKSTKVNSAWIPADCASAIRARSRQTGADHG